MYLKPGPSLKPWAFSHKKLFQSRSQAAPFLVARRTQGPGVFPHMCDVKGRKDLTERGHTGAEVWYQVTCHTHIASKGVTVIHTECSLVPSPTPSFSSLLSTVKRGGPGTSSHVSDVEGRKG